MISVFGLAALRGACPDHPASSSFRAQLHPQGESDGEHLRRLDARRKSDEARIPVRALES